MSVSLTTNLIAIRWNGIDTETVLQCDNETHILSIKAQEDCAHQWRLSYTSPKGGIWTLRCEELPQVGTDRHDFDHENMFHIVTMCQYIRKHGHEFQCEPMNWEDINAA